MLCIATSRVRSGILCAALSVPAGPPAAAGEIEGRVLDPEGKPVAAATVRVLDQGQKRHDHRTSITAQDGSFSATEVHGERVTVRIETDAFATYQEEVSVGEPLTVGLKPGAGVKGQVRDARSSRPIPEARVNVCDRGWEVFGPESCRTVRSDAFGRFVAAGLAEGPFKVTAVATGHAMASDNGTLPTARQFEFYLGPGGRLSGRVVGPRGRPVSDVTVQALGDGPHRSVQTDHDGRFVFEGLHAGGKYLLGVTGDDFLPVPSKPIEVAQGEDVDAGELRLRAGGTLRFRLLRDEDTPHEGDFKFRLANVPARDTTRARSTTFGSDSAKVTRGDNGVIRVRTVPPGARYLAILDADGYVPVPLGPFQASESETTDLGTIVLDEGRVVRGVVRSTAGEALADARIHIRYRDAEGAPLQREAATNERGEFRVAGFPDQGRLVRCSTRAKGFTPATLEEFPPDGVPVEIELVPRGRVYGFVEDQDGGVPAEIEVAFGNDENMEAGDVEIDHERGRYEVTDVPPGVYDLQVDAADCLPGRRKGIEVTSGQHVDAGTIVLERGLSVRGRVVDSGGRPVSGAAIRVHRPTSSSMAPSWREGQPLGDTLSDSAGLFAVGGLTAGPLVVHAAHEAYAASKVQLELSEGDSPAIEIRLSVGGVITGIVRDPDGHPLPGAEVSIVEGNLAWEEKKHLTNADGIFRAEKLTPGSYLVVHSPGESSLQFDVKRVRVRSVDVRDGEKVFVDFDEAEPIQLSGRLLRGSEPVPDTAMLFVPGSGEMSAQTFNLRTAQSDGVGRYEVGLDRPGPYQVLLPSQRQENMPTAVPIVVPDQPQVVLDVVMGAATLTGTVVDPDGAPVARADVHVMGADRSLGMFNFGQRTRTDDAGAFRLEGLALGTVRITCSAEGFPLSHWTATIGPDGTHVDLQLRSGRTLRGKVVDPSGRGLMASVMAITAGGIPDDSGTDADGNFELQVSGEGPVRLLIGAPGFAPAGVMAEGDAPLQVVLVPGGTLRVEVVDADGFPIPGATVSVTPGDPLLVVPFFFERGFTQTDSNGVVQFHNMAAGPCTITASAAGRTRTIDAVVLDGPTTVVLVLE